MNDEVMKQLYIDFDVPWDEIATKEHLINQFHQEYMKRTGEKVSKDILRKRGFTLRKRGEPRNGFKAIRRGK